MDENEIRKFVREVAEETKGNIVVADFAVAVAMKAIAAEREACATVAEEFEDDMGYGKAQKIADAIRMRSNVEAQGRLTAASSPAGVPLERRVGPQEGEE